MYAQVTTSGGKVKTVCVDVDDRWLLMTI